MNETIDNGAKLLFNMFQRIKYLPEEEYKLMRDVLLTNSYCWHPESMLIGNLYLVLKTEKGLLLLQRSKKLFTVYMRPCVIAGFPMYCHTDSQCNV